MRVPFLMRGAAIAALGICACGPAVHVRTVVSPEANLAALRTFRILPAPRARGRVDHLPPDDPMLVNSITNRALRVALVEGFQSRGYVVEDSQPDFVVAYYAAAKHKLDVTWWDYGYTWRPRWWRGWGARRPAPMLTEYTEGTVIVDVLDAASKDLLWRGQGVAVVSHDLDEYLIDLKRTVAAILQEFPAARPALVTMSGGVATP